ncbi:MAG: hypothetical protein ABFD49_09660 [Armatimonadota bacterium]|nr:hypothetical protein [bacterium]
MSLVFGQWVAIAGIIAVTAVFITEVRRWRAPGCVIGRRRRIIRVALTVLVESLFAMMLIGPWVNFHSNLVIELIYWTLCVFLGVAVMILALYDLKAVATDYSSLNRRALRNLREDKPK